MKMKMKKFGKMNSIFEFSVSELGYVEFSWKYEKNIFGSSFKPFLTNRAKNENEDEKIWENEFDLRIFHINDNFGVNL